MRLESLKKIKISEDNGDDGLVALSKKHLIKIFMNVMQVASLILMFKINI